MIQKFKCKHTRKLFEMEPNKLPPQIHDAARKKLGWLDAAVTVEDLRIPPGNRLEALKGDRRGQHSIRIDSQWRVCFLFRDSHAWDVEIVDYH